MRLDSDQLARAAAALEERHARRERRTVEAYPADDDPTLVRVDGRVLRNFCSNDYLGLSRHPELIRAATEALTRDGVGAGASHLVCGHHHEHHALEQELAAFLGRERALLFSTGYMANLGIVSAIAQRHDWVLADRASHASLLDAVKLSGARLQRYPHLDIDAAERTIASHDRAPALIITDGVFSMDGDIAPLPQLAALAKRHGSLLLVDDAHGVGVLADDGGGAIALAGLDARAVPLLMGTLGKAFGSFGAFVAGDAALIDFLLQRARTYIYTTALPPAVAATARAALTVIRTDAQRRRQLQSHIHFFRTRAAMLGLPLSPSNTAIQPLIVGEDVAALELSEALMHRGFWVTAIRPPTVPAGSARLRITLSAAHREPDIDALLLALAQLWSQRLHT